MSKCLSGICSKTYKYVIMSHEGLECLFDLYLTPLQAESFLSKGEMEALFGCLPEMLDFQRVFLQTLEEKITSCPNLEAPEQLQHYSGFCANHLKVQKVLERAKTDAAFKHFLETRNPTNQHSASLESFLIKPVQRILKYPLLLRELALRAMEDAASHINEMQKIYEEFGCVLGSECVLELVHCRSEVEGRPETVFQLCSSDVEMKARVLCALRPLLRTRDPCST
ncbi:T-lymphoma invasion and metastasis-inducing protein 2 [Dissostichus eleginoides]|uniref:T-lymphoma invasion and metastasis-inducing protein 2 n=1 Tax=Dissostichus eleginoides TaxID=100907 RepID=A0AAD9F192_DISEL|nr:T-lymphoma invasion and metastasis-inducing protein 2 [Dissostichus eleginoides]